MNFYMQNKWKTEFMNKKISYFSFYKINVWNVIMYMGPRKNQKLFG